MTTTTKNRPPAYSRASGSDLANLYAQPVPIEMAQAAQRAVAGAAADSAEAAELLAMLGITPGAEAVI